MLVNLLANYDYIGAVILLLYMILKTNANQYIKGLSLVLAFDMFFTMVNYIFKINLVSEVKFFVIDNLVIILEWITILYYLVCKSISYNIKSDKELDKRYIYFMMYKPKSLMQWLRNINNINICSTGLMAYNDKWFSYQMRYGFKTMQKLPRYERTINSLFNDYYLVKTDILKKDLDLQFPNWEEVLQSQKARQWRTLWKRTNCFRSFRFIFNKKYSNKFIYHDFYLPMSAELNCIIWKLKGII
jgi:hypothetical protein